MLTINADDHALMRRFHKPGEDKRVVVILDETEYDAWLDCTRANDKFHATVPGGPIGSRAVSERAANATPDAIAARRRPT